MICTVQIIKTIICEQHHPALKALQQNKVLDEMQWSPAVSLDEHLYKTNGSYRQKVQIFQCSQVSLINMENEHFSGSHITNCYIIIIANSPGRSSIKFYTGKLNPGSNYLQKRYSFRMPFHSSLMVEGSSGSLQAFYPQRVLNKFLRGSPAPRSMSLPFHIPCLTEMVLLSYTIPSLLAVVGWSGLLQAFYRQGVLNKGLYDEALPRDPCPYRTLYSNTLY